jgi:glyoxylase-like metal-dependent hydrolase (beta-lactamase superfamily II)
LNIGNYNIISIQTGLFRLDGGAMFGVVPKVLWNRTNPSDDLNRIQMCNRALLLDNGNRKILIDTGVGKKLSKKLNDIYSVDYSNYSLESSLKKIDISPAEITDVILTHLHFDHCGGCTYYDDDNQLKITFPNAVHYVQKKQYEWAINPTERDKASFFLYDFNILADNKLLNTLNGNYKFDDVISLNIINGHTPNMQIVKISDDINTVIYTADLIPMASHISVPYIMGYDLLPLITLKEKIAYLREASEKNHIIFLEHDPFIECVKVNLKNDNYFLSEKINL